MPENDDETKLGFMNISFGILLGDFQVPQFEGMVGVFGKSCGDSEESVVMWTFFNVKTFQDFFFNVLPGLV